MLTGSVSYTHLDVYKRQQGVNSFEFPQLKKEDFLLIFMTKAQRTVLYKYGNDVVCIDRTHGLSNYNFQLYTLLAMDGTRLGISCCFHVYKQRG